MPCSSTTACIAGSGPPRGQALLFPCSFPAFLPLYYREVCGADTLGSPAPAVPCSKWRERVPSARAGWDTGWSFLAVAAEGCVLVELLGNGARPHLRHTYPVVTAEPACSEARQRVAPGIFSFCYIALRAGNEGCGYPATGIRQPGRAHHWRGWQLPERVLHGLLEH